MTGVSHRVEGWLVAVLVALATGAVCLVKLTRDGYDRYVWAGGIAVVVSAAVVWWLQRWRARPWVVLTLAAAVFAVGYTVWLVAYTVTRVDQAV